MIVKKVGNCILGAELNTVEKQAVEMEIKRQLAEFDRKNSIELEAMFMWVLHEKFGFGEKRLHRLHDEFVPAIEELSARYQMRDDAWLCTKMLKEAGIDIEKW